MRDIPRKEVQDDFWVHIFELETQRNRFGHDFVLLGIQHFETQRDVDGWLIFRLDSQMLLNLTVETFLYGGGRLLFHSQLSLSTRKRYTLDTPNMNMNE